MTIGCNIWMICLKLNWFFYGLSRMLQFSQLVWTPCYSVLDVFNNFLLIYATDRSKTSWDQKRFFIALSLYPLSFFANTPFKGTVNGVFDMVTFYIIYNFIVASWLSGCSFFVNYQRNVNHNCLCKNERGCTCKLCMHYKLRKRVALNGLQT